MLPGVQEAEGGGSGSGDRAQAAGRQSSAEPKGASSRSLEREPLGKAQLVERKSDSPVIDLRVVFEAGSASDPEGQQGLTHLTAQLMAEGGAGDRSYQDVTRALYPMAARLHARTEREQTVFVGRVHRDHLDRFYAIFEEVLTAPPMERADFERIKARAQNEVERELRGSDDERLGKETLQAMLYEDHPYGHPAVGTEQGLESITLKDVRAHRRRVLCAGRAVVGIAGNYPDGFAKRFHKDIKELSSDKCQGRRSLPPPHDVEQPRVWLVDKDGASSVAVSMGMPIDVTRGHPDYPALTLAAAYLGQHRTFVGRLMQQMRGERGLNYGDYAYAEHFEQQGRTRFPLPNIARRQQYFSVWIRPVKLEQAHFAVRMAVRELERFVREGLTKEEFERVRTFARRYYALYLQTEPRRLGFAVDERFYGVDEPWLERLRAAWDGLTAEELNEAIREHIDLERSQIAVVHPEADRFAKELAADEPSPIEYDARKPEEVRAEDEKIARYELGIPRKRMRVIPLSDIF
jgi:zinc protease